MKVEEEEVSVKPGLQIKKGKRKELPEEEEPTFVGMKLKKSSIVKRAWEDDSLETVDLKHHEFEQTPQCEDAELITKVQMGTSAPSDDDSFEDEDDLKFKKKRVK